MLLILNEKKPSTETHGWKLYFQLKFPFIFLNSCGFCGKIFYLTLKTCFFLQKKCQRDEVLFYFILFFVLIHRFFCNVFFFQEESIGFVKIFDFQFLMDLHGLRCPEHDITISGKCPSVCAPLYVWENIVSCVALEVMKFYI